MAEKLRIESPCTRGFNVKTIEFGGSDVLVRAGMSERLERLLGGRRGRGVRARRLIFRQCKFVLGRFAVHGIVEVHARRISQHDVPVNEESDLREPKEKALNYQTGECRV